ncbi:retrotransposon protein, putative, ty1-copia subclass [Tanacetum coccineum]
MFPDSHSHLFFECSFASQVWFQVRAFTGMSYVPPRLVDVLAFLIPTKGSSVSNVISQIMPAAMTYCLWNERNSRLFKKKKSTADQIVQLITSLVRMKLVTFKFKKMTTGSRLLLDQWKIPSSCFDYNGSSRSEGKLAYLEQPLIPLLYLVASQAARDAYDALYDAQNEKDKKKPREAKGKDKGKTKLTYAPKPKIPLPPKRYNMAKDSVCHHCHEVGHWRGNCPSYHVELKKRKNASIASTSGIFTIKLYAFPNKTWMYDTGYGTHICNTSQGLRGSRKLKQEALSLYVGNGMRATVKAIRSFDLVLPSGLIIILDNCHFTPTIIWGVVSISRLLNNGYIYTFTNYGISVSKDNVFYFNAIPRDGIYEIDIHNIYPNDRSMYNVSNKRTKHALDSSYLCHCRIGHINKKRINKLQRDGILQPTNDESLEKCKSCISGKMAHKPFSHQVERAKDLLGLIYIDVCSPFRTVSREGASYFITFTDDFSRYGYVYLMKHKHEVFETFKVFQNEVKNQLGYSKETMGYYFYYPLENKIFVARNAKFFENSLMVQEASRSHGLLESSGSDEGLELIQEEDTQPYKNTSEIHNEVVPTEEYELGDLNEPPNYKAALSNLEFDKWLEAMNTEMQSMKDNQV